jgi:hypothetical protein
MSGLPRPSRVTRALRRVRDRLPFGPTDHQAIFTRIHRENTWGDDESISGPGSRQARAALFRDDLVAALRALDIRVLLDAPCGDFNWTGPVADAVDRYVGVDVVPALVEANRARHGGPRREFLLADLTRDPLPAADAVLCRDGLVHFSYADVRAALAAFRRTGARYLIATSFPAHPENRDIRTGGWRTLSLEAPPFAFPPPAMAIDERCLGGGGVYRDKILGVWPIAALPVGVTMRP